MPSRSAAAARPRRSPTTPAARPVASRAARVGRPVATARRRQAARRRRLRGTGLLLALVAALGLVLVASGVFDGAVRGITLPLRHEDIIRQQAAEKRLDAALIAGVIYAESHFRDGQVSGAGAEGLMQITPATARDIARKSGGVFFEEDDLATPQVNIAYGAYYLRYLLDRFGGDEALALAAYNGGEGNVERWVARATRRGERFRLAQIPFAETRQYVARVRAAERQYRAEYPQELGL